ncbi:MAG: SpoIIE family protein phosphatase [Anaerolineae bacterium]|jgi:sigma-B regulation protein RsbU (phosphoserine phosphatase)|nr:SpoIIE family protein phosphatase [Anaerolineae bacterium]
MSEKPKLTPEHLQVLYDITGQMISSLDFEVALNNVMDSVMQITKAQRGFLMMSDEVGELRTLVVKGVDEDTLNQEGYSTTIVREVVSSRKVLLTNNAQFDTRFQAGQSIIMRGLRAILCAPMIVKNRLMGILYVDTSMKSGNFTQADSDLLSAVAGQAAVALENARLYTVAVEKGRMERELQMASEIQEALLPQTMPNVGGYEIVPYWEAAREMAGDFYDAFKLADDKFGVVIADVSDKGAGAALLMAVSRTMIRANAYAGLSPRETVRRTNDLIVEDVQSGMFVTVYHSVFFRDGRSVHVNAGHNPPLIYHRASHAITMLPIGGRALGWEVDNPVQEHAIQLQGGDMVVYYTDGLTEAENANGEQYGVDRLKQVILDNSQQPAQLIMNRIVEDVQKFCAGIPPFDDMTVMIVRYKG